MLADISFFEALQNTACSRQVRNTTDPGQAADKLSRNEIPEEATKRKIFPLESPHGEVIGGNIIEDRSGKLSRKAINDTWDLLLATDPDSMWRKSMQASYWGQEHDDLSAIEYYNILDEILNIKDKKQQEMKCAAWDIPCDVEKIKAVRDSIYERFIKGNQTRYRPTRRQQKALLREDTSGKELKRLWANLVGRHTTAGSWGDNTGLRVRKDLLGRKFSYVTAVELYNALQEVLSISDPEEQKKKCEEWNLPCDKNSLVGMRDEIAEQFAMSRQVEYPTMLRQQQQQNNENKYRQAVYRCGTERGNIYHQDEESMPLTIAKERILNHLKNLYENHPILGDKEFGDDLNAWLERRLKRIILSGKQKKIDVYHVNQFIKDINKAVMYEEKLADPYTPQKAGELLKKHLLSLREDYPILEDPETQKRVKAFVQQEVAKLMGSGTISPYSYSELVTSLDKFIDYIGQEAWINAQKNNQKQNN